jgi:hypothetical protein
MKLPAHRAGLPGDVDMIIGSVLLPAFLPAGRKAKHPADLPATPILLEAHRKLFFIVLGPFRMVLLPELWNAGR